MKTSHLVLVGSVIGLALFAASIAGAAPPGQAILVSPGGKVTGSTITFLWRPVTSSTKYSIQVKAGTVMRLNRTFTSDQASCPTTSGTCSVEATIKGGGPDLTWIVRAGNADGFGEWSEPMTITISDDMKMPISGLPFTVDTPGSYYVTGYLVSSGNGIIVQSDNATIDLNGYTLTGPGDSGFGIYMHGRQNVEIRNGTVENFGSYGIYEGSGTGGGHRVIGVRVAGNGSGGIYLNGERNLVENCNALDNSGNGIYAAYNSIIRGCIASGNAVGIKGMSGCTISDNTSASNAEHGISVVEVNTIIGNNVSHNGWHGIEVNRYSTVKNNTAATNGRSGIAFLGARSLVDGNTAYLNNQSGGGYPNMSNCATCQWGLNVK